MGKTTFILGVMLSLLFISGCGTSNNTSNDETEWEPTEYEDVNTLDGVTMHVKEGTVSAIGLTVILENSREQGYTYGEYFSLEKKVEDHWVQVPITIDGDYGFNDIGYGLEPNGTSEWKVDWEWLYGSLDSGDYRIVKDILDIKEPGDYERYYLAVEFTLD
ncbi:immunoglobulin-like domain-containing protein [Halalkalibacillus halophilus]|uniref:immunoglobulin-like domain-containing protein n=1 Tax=Halalkalibacillus halophilus TaxID=392827 RepID=UPI00041E7D8D|nr:immunoglobulin-like domain-containing protein [Halalkalibacillus halophilus]